MLAECGRPGLRVFEEECKGRGVEEGGGGKEDGPLVVEHSVLGREESVSDGGARRTSRRIGLEIYILLYSESEAKITQHPHSRRRKTVWLDGCARVVSGRYNPESNYPLELIRGACLFPAT